MACAHKHHMMVTRVLLAVSNLEDHSNLSVRKRTSSDNIIRVPHRERIPSFPGDARVGLQEGARHIHGDWKRRALVDGLRARPAPSFRVLVFAARTLNATGSTTGHAIAAARAL